MAIAKSSSALDKNQALSIAESILEMFQNSVNSHSKPSSSEVGQFFASNLQYSSNGMVVARSLNDYLARIEKAQGLYQNISISDILEEPIVSANRAVIRYDVSATKSGGGKSQYQVLAILTIESGKVVQWSQVVHEKGTGIWDA